MAKLSAFDTKTRADAGVEVELKDLRTSKGSGAFIRVLGTDSDAYQQYVLERQRDIVAKRAAGAEDDLTPRDRAAHMLAALTTGWRNLEDADGPLEFSRDAAVDLYTRYPAIRDQVDTFVSERENFLVP